MTATRVLVIDDEPHILLVVSRQLARAGFEVRSERDGADAVDAAIEFDPHLIVTDLQMPRLDGLSAAKDLRQNPATASIPVIMLTARGDCAEAESVAETNIKHVMAKPFSGSALVALCREVLDAESGEAPAAEAA